MTPFVDPNRRQFVQASVGAAAAVTFTKPATAWPWESAATLRIGLIGCGGRGTGAAHDCLRGNDGVRLVAIGDLSADRVASCRQNLAKVAVEDPTLAAKIAVDDGHAFVGFDAYQKVIDSGVDVVILATAPGFRPRHLDAAIAAGKHVFMEKPVAVDPTGVRSIMASANLAQKKGLAIVAGTQRRHDPAYRATIEQIRQGAIGEIVGGQVYWNQGGLWHAARKPEWSDTEWQIRNWLYFAWLSGDHVVEQHIHNLDVANWVMGGPPVKAVGTGGRQWRTGPEFGHIFDHFSVHLEYPNGGRVASMCRQIDGCEDHVGEQFQGTKGATDPSGSITGASPFTYQGAKPNPYVQEHIDLIASIRAGAPLNEGRRVAESTLTAIMVREAAYTGQVINWADVLLSPQSLTPPGMMQLGPLAVPPVPMPGRTKVDRQFGEG